MIKRLSLALAVLGLAACSTTAPIPEATVVEAPPPGEPQQMQFVLASGDYHCSAGEVVGVVRDQADANRIRVRWQGRMHDLVRNPSASGLPRYERAGSPMVWIDLPWKSYLLDSRSGKPLASECVAG